MILNLAFDLDEASNHYLESSARLRCVSRTHLVRKVLETVLTDQMILSVLDDGDLPSAKTTLKRRPRAGRPRREEQVPRDRLFTGLQSRTSVPTRRSGSPTFSFKNAPGNRTRSEMEADLRQAVLNTGGELVDEGRLVPMHGSGPDDQ